MAANYSRNTATTNSIASTKDAWKSQGFINFFLPSGGSTMKLGKLPLKDSKPAEKRLLDWLNADAVNVTKLPPKLSFEFNAVVTNNSVGFDLGALAGLPTNVPDKPTISTTIGYINVSMLDTSGQQQKLGFIPLHDDIPAAVTLCKWLAEDPTRISFVKDAITLDYHSAVSKRPMFDLS